MFFAIPAFAQQDPSATPISYNSHTYQGYWGTPLSESNIHFEKFDSSLNKLLERDIDLSIKDRKGKTSVFDLFAQRNLLVTTFGGDDSRLTVKIFNKNLEFVDSAGMVLTDRTRDRRAWSQNLPCCKDNRSNSRLASAFIFTPRYRSPCKSNWRYALR